MREREMAASEKMAEPGGGRRRGVAWVVPGDGADHITALPLELRARIAASLPFRQVARLATLSRPWRHIHHHAPIVKLNLNLDEWRSAAGVINEDALAGLEVALARRGQEGSGSKVDTLRIAYNVDNPGIRRHAGLIITLAGARKICVTARNVRRCPLEEWTVDLSPAARDLEVNAFCYLAPTVAGPGAAALQTLVLHSAVLRDWPCLPSLRSLTLGRVIFEAPPPVEWCPRLENLRIRYPMIHVARVDIRLPLLKSLKMDGVYRTPHVDITVDAPELEELHVHKLPGGGGGYKSFTLRAPRLRCLMWWEQFVEHVSIDVGRPSSVTSGQIRFTWSGRFTWNRRFGECCEMKDTWNRRFGECCEMKDFRSQTVQMLEGLLPELPPECVAHAARPYMSLDKYTVEDPNTSEPIPWEKLTCDLGSLMSSLKA